MVWQSHNISVPADGANRAEVPKRREREVLEAAARVFYQRGYADASIQEIADEVGILKGSLYHYISSKEDLLFRLLYEVHEDVQDILDAVVAEPGLDPLQRLVLYTRRQVEYNARNLPKISIYYHEVDHLSDDRRREILPRRKTHEHYVASLIEQAQKAGLTTSGTTPKLLASCVFSTIIWVYRWYRPGGRLTPERLGDVCADYVIRGVAGTMREP